MNGTVPVINLSMKDLIIIEDILRTIIENYNTVPKQCKRMFKYDPEELLSIYLKILSITDKETFKEVIRKKIADILRNTYNVRKVKPSNVIIHEIRCNLGNYLIHGECKLNGKLRTFLMKLDRDLEPSKIELL